MTELVNLQLNRIICNDVMKALKDIPDDSVHMAMTSPAYWGLRSYATVCTKYFEYTDGGHSQGEEWVSERYIYFSENYRHVEYGKVVEKSKIKVEGEWVDAWRARVYMKLQNPLGAERTVQEYVGNLTSIFLEVQRVLKPTGSFYLNIGDVYSGGNRNSGNKKPHPKGYKGTELPGEIKPCPPTGLPDKCLVMIPERIAFKMITEHGWILRNKIIWKKPNVRPESVKGRLTTTWEYIFRFAKSKKEYFNLDAIRVPHKTVSLERYQRSVNRGDTTTKKGSTPDAPGNVSKHHAPRWFLDNMPVDPNYQGKFNGFGEDAENYGSPRARSQRLKVRKQDTVEGPNAPTYHDFNDRWRQKYASAGRSEGSNLGEKGVLNDQEEQWRPETRLLNLKGKNPGDVIEVSPEVRSKDAIMGDMGSSSIGNLRESGYWDVHPSKDPERWFSKGGKNPGDFWTISTRGFPGAHFAVYPLDICYDPILSTCPPDGIVLDPFIGSGTTAEAVEIINILGRKPKSNEELGELKERLLKGERPLSYSASRRWLGYEINPSYAEITQQRLKPYLDAPIMKVM